MKHFCSFICTVLLVRNRLCAKNDYNHLMSVNCFSVAFRSKVLVQNARSLACCIDRLESWLGIGHHQLAPADQPSLTNGKTDDEEEGRVLERVGTEYTKLQYFMRKCDQQEKLLRHIRPVSWC